MTVIAIGRLAAAVLTLAAVTNDALACTIVTRSLVFFHSGSAALTDQALQSIRKHAFETFSNSRCWKLLITGHLDTAEAASPGTDLDRRRAAAVGDALRAMGSVDVEIRAAGTTEAMVRTPPATAEPQNRYVAIKWEARPEVIIRYLPYSGDPAMLPCGAPFTYALPDGTDCLARRSR